MILGDASRPAPGGGSARVTLDGLFHRAALRRPDAIALSDPPNRAAFTQGPARRLTYAQADRIVSGIAAHLRQMGLQSDTVVALQFPNVVEGVLALLGILRAGMIAAPMPLLWRRADAYAALSRVSAKVVIACGRVGSFDHCDLAMHVAADLFPIRYVCAFGPAVPDGVVAFDLDTVGQDNPPAPVERVGNPAAHAAIVTFDVTPEGVVPVARNHMQLIFGALPILLESRLQQDAVIVSAAAGSSFAGLCAAIVPWLLMGGTLALHAPFDAAVLTEQCRGEARAALVVPGPLAAPLAETGLFTGSEAAHALIALWRSPERLAGVAACARRDCVLTDVQVFGEVGLIAARRGEDGKPARIGFGPIVAPRGTAGAAIVGEISSTGAGTVAFRGPMVAYAPFPPGAARGGQPRLNVFDGFSVDTGYPCRVDPGSEAMIVTGPPAGVMNVGAYRFAWRELQDTIARVDERMTLAAVPDPLCGHRLVAATDNVERARQMMLELGLNPLVVAALHGRESARTASAA